MNSGFVENGRLWLWFGCQRDESRFVGENK